MEKIDKDENLENDDEKVIMGIMAQEYHFNSLREGIGVKELKEVFDYTNATIRKKLRNLHKKNLLEKVKGNPVEYVISKEYLESK